MSVLIGHASEDMKPIDGYPGYYVTKSGKVWGKQKQDFLNPVCVNGYQRVSLVANGVTRNHFVHRIVAKAFIPNPNNYPFINHKDENPQNNDVSNLEWCTPAYNNSYGTKGERTSKAQMNRADCSKAVIQYDLSGKYIAEYPSLKEAWRQTGVGRSHIGECCRHYKNQYTAGGYVWRWKEGVAS